MYIGFSKASFVLGFEFFYFGMKSFAWVQSFASLGKFTGFSAFGQSLPLLFIAPKLNSMLRIAEVKSDIYVASYSTF
jgi:hypothetical protein